MKQIIHNEADSIHKECSLFIKNILFKIVIINNQFIIDI